MQWKKRVNANGSTVWDSGKYLIYHLPTIPQKNKYEIVIMETGEPFIELAGIKDLETAKKIIALLEVK